MISCKFINRSTSVIATKKSVDYLFNSYKINVKSNSKNAKQNRQLDFCSYSS